MGIKENWEKEDDTCPTCKQVTKKQTGITKQNIKRLFSFRGNTNDWIITFMLIIIILLAFAYKYETKQSREWVSNMLDAGPEGCQKVCQAQFGINELAYSNLNNTTLIIKDNLWAQ